MLNGNFIDNNKRYAEIRTTPTRKIDARYTNIYIFNWNM